MFGSQCLCSAKRHRIQQEALTVTSMIMSPATWVTRGIPAQSADSWHDNAAVSALVGKLPLHRTARQWKIVTSLLSRNTKRRAGLAPLRAVRLDTPPGSTMMGNEMG